MSFEDWKVRLLSVTSLRLDPKNPRIPENDEILKQQRLIELLVKNDKVYDLTKSIVNNGYYPIENLIAIKENEKHIVVEGNRRLTALKLLIDPQKAPKEKRSSFISLSNRLGQDNVIKKLKVYIAPSRENANLLIMSKHTNADFEAWTPLMKAKFYLNQLSEEVTTNDLAIIYHRNVSELNKLIIHYKLFLEACSLELDDETMEKINNPRDFPISAIERLFNSSEFKSFMGIEFKEDRILGYVEKVEFQKAFKKIMIDATADKGEENRIDTRVLNNSRDVDNYRLNKLAIYKPNLDKKGYFELSPKTTQISLESTSETKAPRKIRKVKKKQPSLIPPDFICDLDNQRIQYIFGELKKLPVSKFPNAVSVLLRGFLEMSLGYYLSKTGILQEIVDKEKVKRSKKQQNLPNGWHPTLSWMLKYVVNETSILERNPLLSRAIGKMCNEKDSLITIDTLNLFTHNRYYLPDEEKLRNFWSQLKDFFGIILNEPSNQ